MPEVLTIPRRMSTTKRSHQAITTDDEDGYDESNCGELIATVSYQDSLSTHKPWGFLE